MPELPDIVVYCEALRERIRGEPIQDAQVVSPFLLRTHDPPLDAIVRQRVTDVRRLGKRIVLELDADLYVVLHLMIAGRLRWMKRGGRPPGKISPGWFEFPGGRLVITEAAKRKRASLHVVRGASALAPFDRGGLDVLTADASAFAQALRAENHTLKRALTDPRFFDGIGNAYSDEILHAARLSPVQLTQRLNDEEAGRLGAAARETLLAWTARLRKDFAGRFPGPGEITAFRPDFAVHGRFGMPCPACGAKVERIRYAENETNYCPTCQTGGRRLADRSLSRLLREDWPRHVDAPQEP